MKLYDYLKKIDFLRMYVKRLKILCEFKIDAKRFLSHYMEKCDKKGMYDYRMLMLVHNLEKGMCMSEPRPFGKDKIFFLKKAIEEYQIDENRKRQTAFQLSISIIKRWCEFYEENNWIECEEYKEIKKFIDKYEINESFDAGYRIVNREELELGDKPSFEEVVFGRKSVREFSNMSLREEDILFCIRVAQAAPTACNRQMVEIIHVIQKDKRDLITKAIYGAGGFSTDTVNYFVFTFDISSLDYYGERNQGYLNAGLVAMNFCNALCSKGIASCFLQWANTEKEEKKIRKALGISDSCKIAVVIGAGYYADNVKVANSCRRNIDEMYRKV